MSEEIFSHESDRFERKSSWAEADKIRQTICAFANDLADRRAPGYIAVGMRDDGSASGASIDDALLLKLAGLSQEINFAPSPSIAVEAREVLGVKVALVTVIPHPFPPMRFRGVPYVRVGPSTRRATFEEETRLVERRRRSVTAFDQTAPVDATLDDLDINRLIEEYFPEAIDIAVLDANGRSIADRLRGLRLLDADDRPVIAALLAYGREPRRFVPGAYVQFVRYAGRNVVDPIMDQKIIDGTLPLMLRDLDDLARINVAAPLAIGDGERDLRLPEYPFAALQQLMRNAVMHRQYDPAITNAPIRLSWFSDRIEIQNPGGLFGQVTPANFGRVSDYRNPLVAEMMSTLGYVQRFGYGVPSAKQQLERNGNAAPVFIFEPEFFQVDIGGR